MEGADPGGYFRQHFRGRGDATCRLRHEQCADQQIHRRDQYVPLSRRFAHRNLKRGSGWAYVSYSKDDGLNGGMWAGAGQHPFVKMADVSAPSSASIFVEESDPRNENLGTWVMERGTWVDGFAIFHGNWSTFSMADGHAEGHTWRDAQTIKAAKDNGAGKASF